MITRRILFFLTFIAVTTFTSCSVESESIFDMFDDVKITFHNDSPYAVTDYRKYNDGDSVHISFTITSENRDMIKLVVDSTLGTGTNGNREFELKPNERRSYSGRLRFKMRRDGKATFRVFAIDDMGVYMGDGYKSVTVEGAPSYTILADRRLYLPDTSRVDIPTFYSIRQGKTFTYSQGLANSADIDFGIYALGDTRTAHLNRISFNFYSISVPVNPFRWYDITNWEKRQTLFSLPITGAGGTTGTFNTLLLSSSRIEEEAKKRVINVTSTSITEWENALAAGSMIYFLTPEGKYGAILVGQSTVDPDGRPYLNITTKIQN